MEFNGQDMAARMGGRHEFQKGEWSDIGEHIPHKVEMTLIHIPLAKGSNEGYLLKVFSHPTDEETLVVEFSTYAEVTRHRMRGGDYKACNYKGGGVPKDIKEKFEEGFFRSRPPFIMTSNTTDQPGSAVVRHYLKKKPAPVLMAGAPAKA